MGERHRSLLEKVGGGAMAAVARAAEAEAAWTRPGLLQGLDPRAKLAGCLALVAAAVATASLAALAALFLAAVLLAYASGIGAAQLGRGVWLGVLFFTGAIALPAPFLVPGTPLAALPVLGWSVSAQGLKSAAFLVGRAETCATFALLLVLTTPWPHLLKAMRSLGAPAAAVAVLGMAHRYLFVLLQAAAQMFEARKSRLVAPLGGAEARRLAVSAAGVLLGRSFLLAEEVHLAMVSRGYRGEPRLLDDFRARPRDVLALALALAAPAAILWCRA